mgnify:CR=1 FL=1
MAIDPKSVPLARVSWRPSYRLIPSRYPTVGLYDAIADAADLEAVFAIEALANPRLRDELGELQLVPPDERVSGPGATPVMAAFTHLNPEGSRFSDGSYGVYYAGPFARDRGRRGGATIAASSCAAPTSRRSTSTCA